jgi:hypothetical protein
MTNLAVYVSESIDVGESEKSGSYTVMEDELGDGGIKEASYPKDETRMYEDATAETARVEEVEVSTVTKVHGIWLVFPIEGEYTVSDKEYRIHVPAGTLDMARIGETGE